MRVRNEICEKKRDRLEVWSRGDRVGIYMGNLLWPLDSMSSGLSCGSVRKGATRETTTTRVQGLLRHSKAWSIHWTQQAPSCLCPLVLLLSIVGSDVCCVQWSSAHLCPYDLLPYSWPALSWSADFCTYGPHRLFPAHSPPCSCRKGTCGKTDSFYACHWGTVEEEKEREGNGKEGEGKRAV